jgi:hypothetical protein
MSSIICVLTGISIDGDRSTFGQATTPSLDSVSMIKSRAHVMSDLPACSNPITIRLLSLFGETETPRMGRTRSIVSFCAMFATSSRVRGLSGNKPASISMTNATRVKYPFPYDRVDRTEMPTKLNGDSYQKLGFLSIPNSSVTTTLLTGYQRDLGSIGPAEEAVVALSGFRLEHGIPHVSSQPDHCVSVRISTLTRASNELMLRFWCWCERNKHSERPLYRYRYVSAVSLLAGRF